MIEAVVCVCGAEEYYHMAEYSIPSFLLANQGTKLTVFSTEPERLLHLADEYHPLEIRDYDESAERLTDDYRKMFDHVKILSNEGWDNDGTFHDHHYVACLPILGQAYANENTAFTLKIDVDSFHVGDYIIETIEDILTEYKMHDMTRDMYLIQRPNNGINKPFGNNWPGVGFLLWLNKGRFLEKYCQLFMGNEQETILVKLAHEKAVSYRSMADWTRHCVYPYWWAKKNGREFDHTQLTPPWYIHLHASDEELGTNRLETMEKLWEEFYG